MAMTGAVPAGGAYVEVSVRGRRKAAGELDRVEKKMHKFSRSARLAGKAMRGIGKGVGKVGGMAMGVAGGMGLAGGAGAIGGAAKEALRSIISNAAEAEATFTRLNMIFKQNSAEATTWAVKVADGFKRTRTATANTLTTFQTLFTGLGFGAQESMKLSKATTRLSFDFGAFTKQADPEMMRRFVAALAGSPEVLDQFGVNIKQAALDQQLLKMGMRDVANGASEQEKTIARLSIIYNAMSQQGALGAAESMAGSFAQQMTRMKNMVTEAGVAIGTQLIPRLKPVIGLIRDLAEVVRNAAMSSDLFSGFGGEIGKALSSAFKDLRTAVDSGDLGIVIDVFWLKFKMVMKETFKTMGAELWDTFKGVLAKVMGYIGRIAKVFDFGQSRPTRWGSLEAWSEVAQSTSNVELSDEDELRGLLSVARRKAATRQAAGAGKTDDAGVDMQGLADVTTAERRKAEKAAALGVREKALEAEAKLIQQFGEAEIREALKTGTAVNRVKAQLRIELEQQIKKAVETNDAREHIVAVNRARRLSNELMLRKKIADFMVNRKELIKGEVGAAAKEGRAPDMVRVQMQQGLQEWMEIAQQQMEQTGRVTPAVQQRIQQLQGRLDTSTAAGGGGQFKATTNAFKAAMMAGGTGTLLAENKKHTKLLEKIKDRGLATWV